jgi:Flavodoxin
MQVLVVYESMYGNTHTIAEAVGRGCGGDHAVSVVPVGDATPERVKASDVVFVGGPTHMHGESWSMTRAGARSAAEKEDLELDPDAEGPGLRTWFHGLDKVDGVRAAAFDTRIDANPTFTGRASKGIARKLRHHGFGLIAEPESFLVTGDNTLIDGEDDRAEAWAQAVISSAVPVRE